jgi:uncharacterized protein
MMRSRIARFSRVAAGGAGAGGPVVSDSHVHGHAFVMKHQVGDDGVYRLAPLTLAEFKSVIVDAR